MSDLPKILCLLDPTSTSAEAHTLAAVLFPDHFPDTTNMVAPAVHPPTEKAHLLGINNPSFGLDHPSLLPFLPE